MPPRAPGQSSREPLPAHQQDAPTALPELGPPVPQRPPCLGTCSGILSQRPAPGGFVAHRPVPGNGASHQSPICHMPSSTL